MDRLKLLKQFAAEEPGDPFNYYALALEHLKTDPIEASRLFESLFTSFPDYLPTYYPYAQLLIERRETEKAELVFEKGKAMAKIQGDLKTLREMEGAYNDWKYDRS